MMAWMNPQAWAGRPAPQGWAGSWPPTAPAGYPGPPPVPPGVDTSRWYTGQWQFNPRWQPTAAIPAQAWAPHPSWGPSVADYNPFKRIPNRGDASYWATKLSDNPLGLSGMIPAEELEKQGKLQHPDAAPQTPWVWAPKDLAEPDERRGNGNATGTTGAPTGRDPQHPQHTHDHHHSHHHSSSQMQSSSSAYDSRTRAQPQTQAQSDATRPSQPWQNGKTAAQAPYAAYGNREGHDLKDLEPPRAMPEQSVSQYQDPSQRRHATAPAEYRTTEEVNGSSASTQARAQTTDNPNAFSSRRELKPTFSPNIVRTPDYYSTVSSASAAAAAAADPSRGSRRSTREDSLSVTPDRRGSRDDRYRDESESLRPRERRKSRNDDDSPPPGPHRHGPIYGPPTPTPSRTTSDITTSTTPSRQSSMPSLSSSMSSMSISTPATSASNHGFLLSTFSEEPSNLLSPLVVNTSPPEKSESNARDLGRSQTYPVIPNSSPSGIPITPEDSPSARLSRTPSNRTPQPSPSRAARPPRTPVNRSRTYPTLDNMSDEPPVIPPYPSPNPMRPSPQRSNSLRGNPLPPPPEYVQPVSSASASIASQSYYNTRGSPHPHPPHSDSPSRRSSSHAAAPFPPQSSTVPYATQSSSASYATQSSSAPYTTQSSSSASAAMQPQPTTRKVRYGYWNRRGDHLTSIPEPSSRSSPSTMTGSLYVVYAPKEKANPEDLASYPQPTDGWMNHRGQIIKYDPNVPELPESLPYHGESPKRPYESFIAYAYV